MDMHTAIGGGIQQAGGDVVIVIITVIVLADRIQNQHCESDSAQVN